jgi:hypothetical protein
MIYKDQLKDDSWTETVSVSNPDSSAPMQTIAGNTTNILMLKSPLGHMPLPSAET